MKLSSEVEIHFDTVRLPNSSIRALIHDCVSVYYICRARDPTAKVLVISNEKYLPYMRPPLSKEMWFTDDSKADKLKFTRWNGRDRSLLFEQDEFYVEPKTLQYQENGGVAIALGRKVM